MSSPDHFDRIARFGNRSNPKRDNDMIRCRDGFELSVIAGGGSYSTPQPALPGSTSAPNTMDHEDYPGPFSAVDVMPYGDVPDSWAGYLRDDIYAHVPVQLVRQLIEAHGGEV